MDVDSYNQRLLLNFTSSLSVEYAIDSGKSLLLSEGSPSPVTNILAHPTESNTVITSHQDFTIRIWDVSQPGHGLQGILRLHRIPTAMIFRDESTLVIAIGDKGYEENHEIELEKIKEIKIEKERMRLKKDLDEDLTEDISVYMQQEEKDANAKAKDAYILFIAMNEEEQKIELDRRSAVNQDEEYEQVSRRSAFKNKLKKSYDQKFEDIIEEFANSLGRPKVDRNAMYLNSTGDMQRLHTNNDTSSLLFFYLTSSAQPMVMANPIRRANQGSNRKRLNSQVSQSSGKSSARSRLASSDSVPMSDKDSNANKVNENDKKDQSNNDIALKYDVMGNLIIENNAVNNDDNKENKDTTILSDFIPINKRYLTRQLLLLGEIGNVGTGKLYQISISPHKDRLVTCSHDGNLYIYINVDDDESVASSNESVKIKIRPISGKDGNNIGYINTMRKTSRSSGSSSISRPTSGALSRPTISDGDSRPNTGNSGEKIRPASGKKDRPKSGLKNRPLSSSSNKSETNSNNNDVLESNNNNDGDMSIINEDDNEDIYNDDDISDKEDYEEDDEDEIKFQSFLKLEGMLTPPKVVTRNYSGNAIPVTAMDWSCNNRFIRTFGPCIGGVKHAISSAYFDFEPPAKRVTRAAPPIVPLGSATTEPGIYLVFNYYFNNHFTFILIIKKKKFIFKLFIYLVKLKKPKKEFDEEGNLLPRFYEDGTPVIERKPKQYDEEGNVIPQLDENGNVIEDSDDEDVIPVKIIAKHIDNKKELDIFLNTKVEWCSISSPAVPEAHGIMRSDSIIEKISSIDSTSYSLLCVSYNNATVKLFRIPVYTEVDTPPIAEISNFFTTTPVAIIMPVSQDGSIRIVAAGKTNGIIAVFKVKEK
jgi:hypothetical protein